MLSIIQKPNMFGFRIPTVLKLLADGFTQKNLRQHNGIYSVYYYWHDLGSYI